MSRTGVRYLRCRSWRSETRSADLAALKRVKLDLPALVIDGMVDDFVSLVGDLAGGVFGSVVPVACGHSHRMNCLSAVLAAALAERMDLPMVRAFKDRFVSGVSHPKEFAKLTPLEISVLPEAPALIVDDVATSGFHIAEAVTTLRSAGVPCIGAVWIAGIRQA